MPGVRIVVLAGGFGGSRFAAGVRDHVAATAPGGRVTVVANTGDDLWIHGLRVCPDLDTIMYTLGGGLDAQRGWGRQDERFTVAEELRAYGVGPDWFGLGDRDIATHLVRRQLLDAGEPLSAITRVLCARWRPGVELLPMTDQPAETHVVVNGGDGRRTMHFQQWWVQHRAARAAESFHVVGVEAARPAPGVLEAIADADAIVIAPSNPVVSIGPILAVPGIRSALAAATAPIVGVSPIIGGAPVRGMADACLAAIGVPCTASGVAAHLGARSRHPGSAVLDGWIVDDADADLVPDVAALGIACRAVPTLMSDAHRARALAQHACALAAQLADGADPGPAGGRRGWAAR